MAVALGSVVAFSFGTADFLGGRASQRMPTIDVSFAGRLVALALVGLALVATG